MNFYPHHLGDYVRDTAHLSVMEDGAYRRLLDAYYIKERPLPKLLKDVFRIVRATTKAEREAVQTVLAEFFEETPEGWRNGRCDAEIRKFNDSAPDREARRENERDRQRRTRERRRQLFDTLREHGIVPAYDASMTELQSLAGRLSSPAQALGETSDAPAPAPHTAPPVTPYVTRDATDTHTPSTIHQTPDKEAASTHATANPARVPPAAEVCIALRQAGIAHVNPGDPRLLALLTCGATTMNFVAAASGASDKRNPFAYVLGTVGGQLAEAASIAAGAAAVNPRRARNRAEERAATMAELTGNTTFRRVHADCTQRAEAPVDVQCQFVD